jgi:TetR/AcrR family fatty acid metabolism transcriptional regulator
MNTVTKALDSRRARKKAAIRERIVTTGIELFSRHGIADVTVEQIAEAADIGKGTVYNYFQTKEDIVVAFMLDVERRVQAKLGKFTASKAPAEEVLSQFIRMQFRMKARRVDFVRAMLRQMFTHTDKFVPYMVEMQKIIDPALEALFRSLQDRGAIRDDLNITELIGIFKTMHMGLTALWAIEGPPFRSTERVVRQEMKLFCEGLKPRK